MTKRIAAILAAVLALCMGVATGCGSPADEKGPDNAFDATKLPYYVEDTTALQYSYSEEDRLIPFWQTNVMRNEQLMIVEKDGVTQGKLLYTPKRVISVRDWTLATEYEKGTDYVIDGDTITLPAGSKIPVFKDEWSKGENIPSQYPFGSALGGWQWAGDIMYTETGLTWQNYIHVSYVYDPADVDRSVLAKYTGALYGLTEKVNSAKAEDKNIKLMVFGDSISEGCSSSATWNHAPQCPPYAELVKYGLEHFGGLTVDFRNISVGGKDSAWAADNNSAFDEKYGKQLPKIMEYVPDVLIIAFGTNDTALNLLGKNYRKNIEKIVETAKAANSECQILLVAPFPSNEKSKSAYDHELICSALKAIVDETTYLDVGYVSMYEGCLKMLEKKNYYEIAANNVNHPNDFIHRFYAMQILNTMLDFDAVAANR